MIRDSIMPRYITATLYDNDFHSHLTEGVPYIAQRAEHDLTDTEFRDWLVDYITYYSAIRVINRSFKRTPDQIAHTRDYVEKNLSVILSDDKPEHVDENWEYVMHDRWLNYTWSA
jgi:hypothetical protein